MNSIDNENNFIQFDRKKHYQLISVKDKDGNGRTLYGNKTYFYKKYINGTATHFQYRELQVGDIIKHYLTMDFVVDGNNQWTNRYLRTSRVIDTIQNDKEIIIQTKNSIYTFVEVKPKEIECLNEKSLIELFLSTDIPYKFVKGIYYDKDGNCFELLGDVHLNMLVDTVLIGRVDNHQGYLARYYDFYNRVEFYDCFYDEDKKMIPFLIHNTGSDNLEIELNGKSYYIKSTDSMRIR